VFQDLLDTYSVFPRFWDFIPPFGFKTRESDIGCAPFRFRDQNVLGKENARLASFGGRLSFIVFGIYAETSKNAHTAFGMLC